MSQAGEAGAANIRPRWIGFRTLRAGMRPALLVPLTIAALWLAAMSRWIAADVVVPWDSKNQFYAFFRFLAASIGQGELPFWNPYHYGGHPSVADPQSLIFAPLFVAYALFDAAPSLRAFDLIVHAHLLIGGLAIGAIGVRARWPAAACVLAAVIFMFGGAAAGRLQHTGIIISYGLFPLALLLLQLMLERRSMLIAVAFAAVASAIALGRNQVALLLCLVLAGAAIAEIVAADRPLRYLRERAGALATAAVSVLLLTAAPMILTLQFAALSNRARQSLDEALLGSLHPANLAQFAVPDIFASQGFNYWGPNGTTAPAVAFTDDSFNYLFIGASVSLVLLWLGVAGGSAFRRGRIYLVLVAAAALIFALGRYTPAFSLAFETVPGLTFFRRPVDGTFVLVPMLALLTGMVLADYVSNGLPQVRWYIGLLVGAIGLAGLAGGIAFSARQGHAADALIALAKTLPIVAVVAAILWLPRTAQARVTAATLVAAIGVLELLIWNTAFRLNAKARSVYAALERPSGAALDALQLVEAQIRERHRQGERPRVEILGLGGAWQNLPMVRSLEAINGYNPLRIGVYDRLIAPGESNWLSKLRAFPASFNNYDCALARALGLEFLMMGAPIETVPHLRHRSDLEVLRDGPHIWVYRLRNPSPRLNFLSRVTIADADAVDASGRPARLPVPSQILIDDDTPPQRSYAAQTAGGGAARILRWSPGRIDIAVRSAQGGMLALHDLWYPGWIAEIDGVRAAILRADVLFRGVEVPAGERMVTFRFAPFSPENLWRAVTRAP